MQTFSLGEKQQLLCKADLLENFISLKTNFAYHCLICQAGFSFKTSLQEHLTRKSFLIKYECKHCAKQLIFYNRCQFWLHLKEHSTQAFTYAKINIAKLPTELLLAEINTPIESLKDYSCPSCNATCFNSSSREDHLTVERMSCECPLCHLICPSFCSLKLHERIHLKKFPFICPECGVDTFQDYVAFEYHCKMKCFHYSRKMSHKCPICKIHVSSLKALILHIVNNHCKKVHFCKLHLKYFKSEMEIKLHKSDHQCELSPNYSCPFCESFLHSPKFLTAHLEEHFDTPMSGMGLNFHCFHCSFANETKSGLKTHLISEHKYFICQYCNNLFEHQTFYEKHITRCIARKCRSCNEENLSGQDMLRHGELHLKAGIWVCLFCDNKEYKTKLQLMCHLSNHATQMPYPLTCWHCNLSYQDDDNYLLHLKILHKCFGLQCSYCKESFESTSQLENHIITEGHSLKVFYCSLCGDFESTLTRDVILHLIENHYVFQDSKFKTCIKTKELSLTNYFLSQSLPPIPAGSSSSPLSLPDFSHLDLIKGCSSTFACKIDPNTLSSNHQSENTHPVHKTKQVEQEVGYLTKSHLLNGSHSPSHYHSDESEKSFEHHYKNGLSCTSSSFKHFKASSLPSIENDFFNKRINLHFKIKNNVIEPSHQVDDVSDEDDSNKSHLLNALGLTASRKFSCKQCNLKFFTSSSLDTHISKDHFNSKQTLLENISFDQEDMTCLNNNQSQIMVHRKRLKT